MPSNDLSVDAFLKEQNNDISVDTFLSEQSIKPVELQEPETELNDIMTGKRPLSIINPYGAIRMQDVNSPVNETLGGITRGVGKNIVSSGTGILRTVLPKGGNPTVEEQMLNKPHTPDMYEKIHETLKSTQKKFEPKGTAENVGKIASDIAMFLAPTNRIVQAEKRVGTLGKMAIEGITGGGMTYFQEGEYNNKVKTNALISAAIPWLGGLWRNSKLKSVDPLERSAEKIENTIIRPNDADLKNGYKASTIFKENLIGGNLKDTLVKTENKLQEYSYQLNEALKSSNNTINIDGIFQQAEKELLLGSNNKKQALMTAVKGNRDKVENYLKKIYNDIVDVTKKSDISVQDANTLKQGLGLNGAWNYGRADVDSDALETVSNNLYSKFRQAIEDAIPDANIKGINQKISELIPVKSAIIRRIPVQERNNVVSLSDTIWFAGMNFNPQLLATYLVTKGLKTQGLAKYFYNAAQEYKKEPKNIFYQRFVKPNTEKVPGKELALRNVDLVSQSGTDFEIIPNVNFTLGEGKNLSNRRVSTGRQAYFQKPPLKLTEGEPEFIKSKFKGKGFENGRPGAMQKRLPSKTTPPTIDAEIINEPNFTVRNKTIYAEAADDIKKLPKKPLQIESSYLKEGKGFTIREKGIAPKVEVQKPNPLLIFKTKPQPEESYSFMQAYNHLNINQKQVLIDRLSKEIKISKDKIYRKIQEIENISSKYVKGAY